MDCISVAIFCPVDTPFTYEWPAALGKMPLPGCRVRVPFGRKSVVGIALGQTPAPENVSRIKPAEEAIDKAPLWDEHSWKTWLWMADYYHHPIGDALATTLPSGLAKGETPAAPSGRLLDMSGEVRYLPTSGGEASSGKQRAVLKAAATAPNGQTRLQLIEQTGSPRVVDMLIRTGALSPNRENTAPDHLTLNDEQSSAALAIKSTLGQFAVTLLDGVTGSGKTEVFMEAIAAAIEQGKQVLYLVPEIGLTPQTCARLEKRFEVCTLHSKLSESDRSLAWSMARSGQIQVVIGTRSALFTPIPNLGLIILDEEHDHSYKQDSRLRYHARDVAIYLASRRSIPVVLGSATPSAESYRNALAGKYQHLRLDRRATGATMPALEILDAKSMPQPDGLTPVALGLIRRTLEKGEQAMVYLPRRGFAHALFCTTCGWASECQHCSARMVYHRSKGKLICHHCSEVQPQPCACPKCNGEIIPLGAGTQRTEALLIDALGAEQVLRLDTDVVGSPTAMQEALARIRSGNPLCIVGTQMLSKGHDFPGVTLVVIAGTDAALFSADARAGEGFIQQVTQVAGRSGRSKPGRVIIQTMQADNPLLQQLVNEGYHATLQDMIQRYEEAMLPPVCASALITVETPNPKDAQEMLEAAIDAVDHPALVGPFPAIMERRAGAHRFQAVVLAETRKERHEILRKLKAQWRARTTRFPLIIDVDPCQMG